MQRFVLRENVARFERLLAQAGDDDREEQRKLGLLLACAQRDLAVLDSNAVGLSEAHTLSLSLQGGFKRNPAIVRDFQRSFEASELGYAVIDPRPGLRIIDINDAFVRVTLTRREGVVGECLFEAFPDNPDHDEADGVANAYASLKIAAETRRAHIMPIQRYDVRDESGQFVPSYWRPVNTPILDDDGRVLYLLHHSEDVTQEVLGAP